MKVNGTVLLTRKALVIQRFGAEAWHGLFRDLALLHSCFRRPITMDSMIPLPEFLAFHDELVQRFYPGRKQALVDLGVEVAHWGCQSTSQPVDPSPCVAYSGCQSGYPVVWCLNEGQGHAIPSYGSTAIAEFFMQF